MTDAWDGSSDETAATQVMALPPMERRVLAALAVVGHASLSADELALLVERDDVAPLIDDLELRGLIKRDEKRRYSAFGRVGEEICRTDDALSTGDRLMEYMTTLAKEGRLTPERLLDDTEAILGLTEWAAEHEQWERLLELVKTLRAAYGIAGRVEEWLTLLKRARSAALALGDKESEISVLRQLATASASAGDAPAAQRYRERADDLQRTIKEADAAGPQTAGVGGGGVARVVLWVLALIVVAAAGAAAGYALGHSHNGVGATTTQVPITVTVGGRTVTTAQTVTLPATTVTSVTTLVTTTTVTVPPTASTSSTQVP